MAKIKQIFLLFSLGLILVSCNSTDNNQGDNSSDFAYTPDQYIIGIEPGAGTTEAALRAIEDYGLDQTLTSNASSVMTQLLGDAIRQKAPVVSVGWVPHWKFQAYDLKFLDDPLNSFGESDNIEAIVRKGFKEDNPGAYKLIDNFYWYPEDLQEVMYDMYQGTPVDEAARNWIEKNPEYVEKWTEGVPRGNGQTVTLGFPVWDSEYASANVLKAVLNDMGYNCIEIAVEVGPMFSALAYGSLDATVAAWLPLTHSNYQEKYGYMYENLGPNLENARIGLVVPTYMEDTNSIEDLNDF